MRSELHPAVQARLEQAARRGVPRPAQLSVAGARRQLIDLLDRLDLPAETEPVDTVDEYVIPGPEGSESDVRIKVYTPSGESPFPVVVFFRGSGWTIGNLDVADGQCRRLANRADCVVVSVEYRLAPEHPFPAPLKDAYVATEWVADNPDVVRGDQERIGVAGVSAGGNLAAAVSLLARDRDGPELAFQLLVAPALAYDFDTASYEANAKRYGLERADMKFFWDNYLADPYDAVNGYACPLAVHDLSNLPEALVVTGGFDPLRDDGVRYAERLQAAGVPTEHRNYADMPHPVFGMVDLADGVDTAEEAVTDVAERMKEGLQPTQTDEPLVD